MYIYKIIFVGSIVFTALVIVTSGIKNGAGNFYDINTPIKLSNNGSLGVTYGENC